MGKSSFDKQVKAIDIFLLVTACFHKQYNVSLKIIKYTMGYGNTTPAEMLLLIIGRDINGYWMSFGEQYNTNELWNV